MKIFGKEIPQAVVTDDGVLEFIVDCDGTAGSLFVDTFSATVA